jgi:hypothetical protein
MLSQALPGGPCPAGESDFSYWQNRESMVSFFIGLLSRRDEQGGIGFRQAARGKSRLGSAKREEFLFESLVTY